jgi:hypothetical protein
MSTGEGYGWLGGCGQRMYKNSSYSRDPYVLCDGISKLVVHSLILSRLSVCEKRWLRTTCAAILVLLLLLHSIPARHCLHETTPLTCCLLDYVGIRHTGQC